MKIKNEPDRKLKEDQGDWRGSYIGGQTADREVCYPDRYLITGVERIDEEINVYFAPKIEEK